MLLNACSNMKPPLNDDVGQPLEEDTSGGRQSLRIAQVSLDHPTDQILASAPNTSRLAVGAME
jgi:hypothetical protein